MPGRHRFHSICPYFAMFPETFAEKWIGRLTRRNQLVLDPFCGRGTTPFQSLLMERRAIGSDINPVAYCVTRAKTNAPAARLVRRRITELEKGFRSKDWDRERNKLPEFFPYAFSTPTLRQLLYVRRTLEWADRDTDSLIAGLTLGALHGESQKSPSYLSNQMPRTISTKPAYSVRFWKKHGFEAPERNVFELLRKSVSFRYESDPPKGRAKILKTDMRELPRLIGDELGKVRCVVTSPPYLDVTNFEEDQWLRLWFLGGAPNPTYRVVSKDDRHKRADKYWDMISDMWRMLGQVLGKNANVVIRIGGKGFDPDETAAKLEATSLFSRRKTKLVEYETSQIKKRQTDVFRPGSKGCLVESDFHFHVA